MQHVGCRTKIACFHDLWLFFFFSNKKRRLLHDDVRGVGEVLNETVCVQNECEGLTVSMPFQLIFSTTVKQGLSWSSFLSSQLHVAMNNKLTFYLSTSSGCLAVPCALDASAFHRLLWIFSLLFLYKHWNQLHIKTFQV